MKRILFCLFFIPFTFLRAFEIPQDGMDQFQLTVIGPMYALTKAIDVGVENEFKYVKILSYEFIAHGHEFHGFCKDKPKKGKYVEYKDEHLTMGLVGFRGRPSDPYVIDIKEYKEISNLLDELEEN